MILVRVPVAPFPPGTAVLLSLIVPLLPGAILLPVPSASAILPFLFLMTVSVHTTVPVTSATITIVCGCVCVAGPVPAAPGPVAILLSALSVTSVVGPVGVLIGVFMTIGDIVRDVMAIPGAASGLTRVFVERQVLNRWGNTFCE